MLLDGLEGGVSLLLRQLQLQGFLRQRVDHSLALFPGLQLRFSQEGCRPRRPQELDLSSPGILLRLSMPRLRLSPLVVR